MILILIIMIIIINNKKYQVIIKYKLEKKGSFNWKKWNKNKNVEVNSLFGMTLQFLSLEYLIFFPALIYFCIGEQQVLREAEGAN